MDGPMRIDQIPSEYLASLVKKRHDWLLAHLQAETLFDSASIGNLLELGKQAVRAELEHRQKELEKEIQSRFGLRSAEVAKPDPVTEADLDAMFGPVLHFGVDVAVDSMGDLAIESLVVESAEQLESQEQATLEPPVVTSAQKLEMQERLEFGRDLFDLVYKAPKVDPVFDEPF